jgi:nucleotide-binding universal stress UspA family protein
MTNPIVVGVDGREPSDALDFAAALARGLETKLVLVHVAGVPIAFPYGNVRLQELMRREAVSQGTEMLEAVAEPVRSVVDELRVEFGEPADELRRVAHDVAASLIVLFPRERRGFARTLWPGTSAAVAAESPCPVVVVRRTLDGGDRILDGGGPIVVGSDGGDDSARAVLVADSLSDRLDLPVLPVGIDVAGKAAHGAIRYRNVHSRPGQALAEIARRARGALLVVGTRGGSRLSGSVAQRLIGETTVPLVVVPERGRHA